MSDDFDVNKRSAGVFLTEGDPFGYEAFGEWLEEALDESGKKVSVCEPYAGKNGLLFHLSSHFPQLLGSHDISYASYDIDPPSENLFPASPISKANTLLKLPGDFDIVITNPPYLARNSARRRGLDFPFSYVGTGMASPQDLYQIALDTCLRQARWICFLIPESFLTSRYDKARTRAVISLPGGLFTDTDCPVCLALFGPDKTKDFSIYGQDGKALGTFSELEGRSRALLGDNDVSGISFNVPEGILGLRGVDDTRRPSIRFVPGGDISPDKIKVTSRAITRISVDGLADDDLDELVEKTNAIVGEWRRVTNDVFLTAFKGIRKDGRYRRRMSYDIAAEIIAQALHQMRN